MIASCDVDISRNLIYLYDRQQRSIHVGNNFNMSFLQAGMKFTSDHHVLSQRHVKVNKRSCEDQHHDNTPI